jgi:hypothetical protein
MADLIFDVALLKRFTNSSEVAQVDISADDVLLIKEASSGAVMKLPLAKLAKFIAESGTEFFKVAGTTNEYVQTWKNAASKDWTLGVNASGSYYKNETDNITVFQISNAGKVGLGASPSEKLTVASGSDEYAVSWTKTSAKKWVLGSYVGGSYVTNATDGRKHIQMLDTGETLIFGNGSEAVGFDSALKATFKGAIKHASSTLLETSVALSDNGGANTATLTNAPLAGNPTKWLAINDNGTIRRIPSW